MRIRGWASACIVMTMSMACDKAVVDSHRSDQGVMKPDVSPNTPSVMDMSMVEDMVTRSSDMTEEGARADMRLLKEPPGEGARERARDPNSADILAVTCCDDESSEYMDSLSHLKGKAPAGLSPGKPLARLAPPSVKSAVKLGSVTAVKGSCDVAAITTSVRRRITGIKRCHEKALRSMPDLTGEVTASVVFSEKGLATSVEAASTSPQGDELSACVKNTLKRIRYATQQSGECSFTCKVKFATSTPE
jgi:hypothetical protein